MSALATSRNTPATPAGSKAVAVLGRDLGLALDFIAGFLPRKLWAEVEAEMIFRVGYWTNPANGQGITPADIGEAGKRFIRPVVLARLNFDNQVLAEFAACVEQAKAERLRREEREQERRRQQDYANEPTIRERFKARQMLRPLIAGIGIQVGRGRPSPTGHSDGDQDGGKENGGNGRQTAGEGRQ